jgi:hypothetical protein
VGLALGLMLKNLLCHGTNKFFTSFFVKKKTLSRGQKTFFLLQRIQIFTLCVACPQNDADKFSL